MLSNFDRMTPDFSQKDENVIIKNMKLNDACRDRTKHAVNRSQLLAVTMATIPCKRKLPLHYRLEQVSARPF